MATSEKTFEPPKTDRQIQLAGVPLASFGRRAAALVTDFLIAGIIFIVATVGGGTLLVRLGLLELEGSVMLNLTFFGNWYSVVWLVAYFTLGIYFGRGRTPGKRLFRIRVVSVVHEHVGLWHSFERALGYGASALEAGFGFLQYFFRKDRRTVHDRIAETIVVSERRPGIDSVSEPAAP